MNRMPATSSASSASFAGTDAGRLGSGSLTTLHTSGFAPLSTARVNAFAPVACRIAGIMMLLPARLSPMSSSGADGSAGMSAVPPVGVAVTVSDPGFIVTTVCCVPAASWTSAV